MDKQRIARELVSLARELVGKGRKPLLIPRQIEETYGDDIVKYFESKLHEFQGATVVGGLAVCVLKVLDRRRESTDHLSNRDLDSIAKILYRKNKRFLDDAQAQYEAMGWP